MVQFTIWLKSERAENRKLKDTRFTAGDWKQAGMRSPGLLLEHFTQKHFTKNQNFLQN
ncbi:hypothetical protein RESH_05615 [Rhodopirellula europaea SH398]|uniref:Uncharacterized protein n=1 Tax=Rhodopirellula europaea SH398 TaxID=1263868 RepID=M5SCB3_9BACT|nr:hypothetical protein RESH_05615 [Rhodopirellula europaea SH398]